MAIRCITLLRTVRFANASRFSAMGTLASELTKFNDIDKSRDLKKVKDIVFLEDPETFGTLSRNVSDDADIGDKDDIKEEEFLQNVPLASQKLTIKQYADIIKQYIKYKRFKEAFDVLEVRMLKDDRVKPENYIYNILIGACADIGYTKKAFKLFNDMKRRALKATGDTYTSLFHACANSPWIEDGLKKSHNLRNLMLDKGIEPNLTNYNAMIKAFGRCGDLATAFKIVDEMAGKGIKIRVHTFNHLLHACISDKNSGFRHALIVWRKMLKCKEKPNIYSFNLMLKCAKDCNLGSKEEIEELISVIGEHIAFENQRINILRKEGNQQLTLSQNAKNSYQEKSIMSLNNDCLQEVNKVDKPSNFFNHSGLTSNNLNGDLIPLESKETLVVNNMTVLSNSKRLPNLLSKDIKIEQVIDLKPIESAQDKFSVIGGQEEFLKEMEVYSVKPDIKTFTQMLPLIENSTEAELKLLDSMNTLQIKADIDFYNMLIKKRCLRLDYKGAFDVKDIIKKEVKLRKKKHFLNKKLKLKFNVMTYGVLAMACKNKEDAEKIVTDMKENNLKLNAEILGPMLKHAVVQRRFSYIYYIMNIVKEENVKINNVFIKHLEEFNNKCIQMLEKDKNKTKDAFYNKYLSFSRYYTQWLKDVNAEDALKSEHPWQQYEQSYPETLQNTKIKIKEPRRFYRKNRKFVKYVPYKP